MDSRPLIRDPAPESAVVEEGLTWARWGVALAVTVAVRFYLFLNYHTINNDGVLYIRDARHFFDGQWAEALASFYPPLFPLMIAGVYPLVGEWELAGQFWPALLGILTLIPLGGLLKRTYGSDVAFVALLVYGVSPYLARLSMEVRTEMPYVFFLVLALYCVQRGADEKRRLWQLWAGLSVGCAYLSRPEGIGLVVVAGLFLLYRRFAAERGSFLAQVCALVAGVFILVAPYVVYLRQDTGHWSLSRKAGLILSMGLAQYDEGAERVSMEESEKADLKSMIVKNPGGYAKKVFFDIFRALGFYFEALHYPFLLFLLLGLFVRLRNGIPAESDLLLLGTVVFYLASFAMLYMTRRYGIPLAAISLGWVGVGVLCARDFCHDRWPRSGGVVVAVLFFAVLGGTLPKTLHAIGEDKSHFREAGLYLKGRKNEGTLVSSNARVMFYAQNEDTVRIKGRSRSDEFCKAGAKWLGIDEQVFARLKNEILDCGWTLDREFSWKGSDRLFVFQRSGSP